MSKSALDIYLNDHRAGAEAGVELANKLRERHVGTRHEAFFIDLASDIEADRDTLDSVMTRLGVEKSSIKQAAGWVAEKVSRIKLNEHLTGSPELTQLLEAETLSIGITGKRALWRALGTAVDRLAPLTADELDVLITRAEAQLAGLEQRRLEFASTAWTAMSSGSGSAQNQKGR